MINFRLLTDWVHGVGFPENQPAAKKDGLPTTPTDNLTLNKYKSTVDEEYERMVSMNIT